LTYGTGIMTFHSILSLREVFGTITGSPTRQDWGTFLRLRQS
jgi:hypothetical protein